MKILKQITLALVLLVSFNTYATTACIEDTEKIKEELIAKMGEDEIIASVYTNIASLTMIESLKKEYNLTGKEYEIDYEKFNKGLKTDLKIIESKYPEFYNLSEEDKKDVLEKSGKSTTRTKKLQDTMKCIIIATAGIAGACGTALGLWALKKYGACMVAGGSFIIAEEILSGGSATGLIPEEISGVNTVCLRFALRLDRQAAQTLATCVIVTLVGEIFACGTTYLLA
ncbi:hypothetical protein KORDIASMS9_04066 [Kordia sp. SMS9]|uniref:hypothetical protein n=1 Tax=Kordia sp. SMS9 TaxID=2282170 RepID=UPI000E0DC72B|nr:hypothetical protein [Kordia sp. SMS9]AXG71808.1 hypothetical protein KORDIASMS9_04066 [Kordia sp. SMS9]